MSLNIKAILFDWDDTLLLSLPKQYEAIAQAIGNPDLPMGDIITTYARAELWLSSRNIIINNTGKPISEEQLADGVSKIYREMLHISEEKCSEILPIAMGRYTRRRFMRPNSLEFIKDLRARGIKTGIVTNNPPSARNIILKYGINKISDCIIISGEVGVAKPSPRILEIALSQLNIEPADAAYVGDSPYDMLCANAAGVRAIWMDNGIYGELARNIAKPDAVIKSIEDLDLILHNS